MLVRLAFSVMIQADADILLIDEVLAVGDASFQQKCVGRLPRHAGRKARRSSWSPTTWPAVETFCHRAMLIEHGTVRHIGDPEEVGRRYMRMNFDEERGRKVSRDPGEEQYVHLVEASLRDGDGTSVTNLEVGQPIIIDATLEALQTIERPIIGLLFTNEDGVRVFGTTEPLYDSSVIPDNENLLSPGTRFKVSATFENKLTTGRYTVGCFVAREVNHFDFPLAAMRLVDFIVFGTDDSAGVFRAEGNLGIEVVD